MEGFFLNNSYWFRMIQCHTCDKGGGSLDNRPQIQMSTQLEYNQKEFVEYETGIGDMSKIFLGKFNASGDEQTMAKGDSGTQK